jgi:hypothetical protein
VVPSAWSCSPALGVDARRHEPKRRQGLLRLAEKAGDVGQGQALKGDEGEREDVRSQRILGHVGEENSEQHPDRLFEPGGYCVDHHSEGGIGAPGHRQFHHGYIALTSEDVPQQFDSPGEGALFEGQFLESGDESGLPFGEDMFDGGHHQILLGGEVMGLGSA